MSASREKKLRQDLAAQGVTDPKLIREAEEKAKARKTNTLYGIIAALFVLVAAAVLVYNSGVLQRGKTAVVIDGEKYTAAQVNYYYMSRKNSILNSGYATYYGLDSSKSMDSQIVSDTAKMLLQITDESEMTWDEYLRNDAIRTLTVRAKAAKLAEEKGKSGEGNKKDYLKIVSYTEDGRTWKYGVVLADKYAPKTGALDTMPFYLGDGFSTLKEAQAFVD